MNRFFTYLNLFSMPLWLAMMFAPRHPVTERLGQSGAIFGLGALHYVIAIIIALKYGPQERQQAGQPDSINVTSLNGIRDILSTRSGTLAAWAHMLALDLFTGGWIYRQSRQLNAPHWVRLGSLLFTLIMGPLGLLLFLLWRMFSRNVSEAL